MATALALMIGLGGGGCVPALHTNGAGGMILVSARACGAPMTIALRDAATGRLLRVRGNPHRARTRRVTLQWVNYCGPRRALFFELTAGRHRLRERQNWPGARCESAKAPSTLTVFRIRG